MRPARLIPWAFPAFTFLLAAGPAVATPPAEEEEALPRNLTPAERALIEESPITVERGVAQPPTGPVFCPGEYEPMDAIIVSWEGPSSWKQILAQMGAQITTTGDADLYIVCDTSAEAESASGSVVAAGADAARVRTVVTATDSIWVRDYGPRYIYEGDCRAIVDHTYNRPRPNDNLFPSFFSQVKGHARYEIPLVHGGGNYHIASTGLSRTTRLINNENPGLTEQQIFDLWADYQSVSTNFYEPLPSFIDATQHIDMWMQVIGDNAVVISDWPNNPGSAQDQVCDAAAASLAAEGYAVTRVPAFSVGGTHYTYTNVVMCNDLVLIPSYTNSTVAPSNSTALAAWQSALPAKTIVQINCEGIVFAAGVMHCIVMHVPAHLGGENPTAYVRSLNQPATLQPGETLPIEWISDDDEGVVNVDILLSTDAGATFDTIIAAATADDGSFLWTVPDINAPDARLRIVTRDADGRTGFDDADAAFAISGGPDPDLTGDGVVDVVDLSALLGVWGPCDPCDADLDGDGVVGVQDLAILLGAWG